MEAYAATRNPYLKDGRTLDPTNISERVWRLVGPNADGAIRKHMTPDDVAAQAKERRGVIIPDARGKPYRHDLEGGYARNSVINRMKEINKVLHDQRSPLSDAERELLQRKLSQLSVLLDEYERGTGEAP